MTTFRLGSAVLLTLALLVAPPALADAAKKGDDVKVRVVFGDLNIHEQSGAKALYARMKRASRQACGVDSYRRLGSLKRVRDAQLCYDDVLQKFVSRIDSAALRALHNG